MVLVLIAALTFQTTTVSARAAVIEYRLEVASPEQGHSESFKWRNDSLANRINRAIRGAR